MTFACLDFETANHFRSSACQLGVVIISNGKIERSKSWLIQPTPFEFEQICVSKHGIRSKDVYDAPTFDVVWGEIEEFIGDATLVAHNAGFDMSVLRHVLAAYELPIPRSNYLCTVQIARTLWRYPSNSLPFLAAQFGIDLIHHNALSDAMACSEVLQRAMNELSVIDERELTTKLGITPGILEAKWGHESPRAAAPRRNAESISSFFKGRLADLSGQTVSTTGKLGRGLTREHLKELVAEAGGEFHPTPRKTTQMFVLGTVDVGTLAKGEKLTAKHRTAMDLFKAGSGIRIISADDFLEQLILDPSGES